MQRPQRRHHHPGRYQVIAYVKPAKVNYVHPARTAKQEPTMGHRLQKGESVSLTALVRGAK